MARCDSIHRAVLGFTILQGVLAGIILLVLSFIKKRTRLCPTTLHGVPGLPTPVNLLQITPHRVISAFAFASMSSSILANILNPPSLGTVANPYGQVFIDWLTTWFFVLLQAILYFPLFGCLCASIGWLGMLMGAIYSALTLFKDMIRFVEIKSCWPLTVVDVWISFGMNMPVYLCLFLLTAYYSFKFVHEVWKCTKSSNILETLAQPSGDKTDYYKEWVKELFNYKRPEGSTLLSYRYQPKVFKFSPRFISTIFIMFVLIYQLTLFSINVLLALQSFIATLLINLNLPSNTIQKIEKGLQAVAVIGPCITSIIILCNVIYMLKCIRSDLKNSFRGDFSSFHLPNSLYKDSFNVPIPTPEVVLKSSLDYMSYQVAYLIISWTIFLFLVLGSGATIAIIVLLFIFGRTFILPKAVSFIMVGILGLIMSTIQKYMCRHVFNDSTIEISNGKKKTPTAKDTSIAHIQLFHWWTYVFFIFNTFSGLFSSLKRSLYSASIVMLLLIRMDRNIYIRGFESKDKGYSTYIAILYLEFTQNNPIANCFAQILLEECATKNTFDKPVRCNRTFHKENYDVILDAQPYKGYFRVSRKARNRWYVTYTLLRNPGIQHTRVNKPPATCSTSLSSLTEKYVDLN